jgi:hypothetical protein
MRAPVIEAALAIESAIELIIEIYLGIYDDDRAEAFEELLLDGMTFGRKVELLREIVAKVGITAEYREVMDDVRRINEQRNWLAHGRMQMIGTQIIIRRGSKSRRYDAGDYAAIVGLAQRLHPRFVDLAGQVARWVDQQDEASRG